MEATREPTFGSAVRVAREKGFFIGSHVPQAPTGMVLLTAMSDGTQDHSQDAVVGQVLRDRGLATLSIRLLSIAEEAEERRRRYLRFQSELLAERLEAMVDWLRAIPAMAHVKLGLMASTTDAAAAALTAVRRPNAVGALVLCGALLDDVEASLPLVKAPTLLVIGERDLPVLAMNEEVLDLLGGENEMATIARASQGFSEPHAVHEVARIASDWFLLHLARPAMSAHVS